MKTEEEIKKTYWRAQARKSYYSRVEYMRERSECYRYPQSTQCKVDSKWLVLRKMANPRLFAWAASKGFDRTMRTFVSFWKCVEKNRQEGDDAVQERIGKMREFHAKVKRKRNG